MSSLFLKPVEWIGSSLDDLKDFPDEVQQVVGYALYIAQCGDKHPAAKPLKGFKGAGVVEMVEDLMEILIGQFIRSNLLMLFMFCIPFRRNRNRVLPLQSKIWI
ncbi:hypothetical protein Syn7502_00640 [Synechococcus sp. PCC 7502]|nr:hypothetical protein Syn7502_00640 [Synechococcus sp. PCC 7502]